MKNILIILCCFSLINLTAQDWKTFTNNKEILDIEKEGNTLWIATSGGLLNWNLQTEAYYKLTTEDGLISNYINEIAIDADGNKWLATNRGVSVIQGGVIISYNSDNGLFTNDVNSVVIDSQGNKWFATKSDNGKSAVSKLDNQGNWTTIAESIYFAPTCMTIDAADNIYIGTFKEIAKYTPGGEWTIFLPPSPESIGWISEMIIDENQEVWAVSPSGLYHYDSAGNQTLFDVTSGLISYPRSLYIDSNHTKWIGTDTGFSRMNSDSTFLNFNLDEQVATIFEENGNVLLGTVNDIISFDGDEYKKLSTGIDLAGNMVRGLDISNDGSVWLGTENGISKYSQNLGWNTFTENDGLLCDPGYSLLATSQDELIISHRSSCNGVSIIDISSGEASFIQDDTFRFILSLNEDASGNIWLGNYLPQVVENSFVIKISPNGNINFFDFTTILQNSLNNKTTGIAIHPNGDVYFSTRWGIYYIDTNNEIHLFKIELAKTIFIDSQENIWIAKGDYFGPNQSLEKYTPNGGHVIYQNGEINNFVINEIIEDEEQNIWVASENGLFKLSSSQVFTRYSTLDGLADNDVTGIEFDTDGSMWISTRNGVSTTADISTTITNLKNEKEAFNLYPNPTLATVTLEFEMQKSGNVKIEVYNVTGQLLLIPFDGEREIGNCQEVFDMADFSQGIYFCKIEIDGQTKIIKFVKI
ncbi:MAG: two-component regulator propeller domain-containing protein [Saprospiraceae bacterium]|nr:two-component regulator propeller domain-containing protein [Saprospiraceae bacterium]